MSHSWRLNYWCDLGGRIAEATPTICLKQQALLLYEELEQSKTLKSCKIFFWRYSRCAKYKDLSFLPGLLYLYVYLRGNLNSLLLYLQNISRMCIGISVLYSGSYNFWLEYSLTFSEELNLQIYILGQFCVPLFDRWVWFAENNSLAQNNLVP